ncbi:MAG: sialate O-acetylesterase [Thalassobius sp.]|nr:sialate O-acetylesterase [Thalassovita sp.]
MKTETMINKITKATCLFSLLLFFVLEIKAEVTLPAIFGDNMVLQQQTDAAIWGKASPSKKVSVTTSWNKKTYSATADKDGKWKVKVATPVAGGPYQITISDGKTLKLNNVLIGEVWICSGQSNMQMTMLGYKNQPIIGANRAIATSKNNNIRLFTVERERSLEPVDDFKGDWKLCEPENVGDFSAAAYFFGKMINQSLDVPVGLICTSWGGTRIEPWMSEEKLKQYDWVKLPEKDKKESQHQDPTSLFNKMINPMVGYALRGGLWYQGEANRNEPKEYEKLMAGLVENWREVWGIGDFPFYYAQIAPYFYGKDALNSAYIREAQLKASTAIPNMGMVSLMDAGEKHCIHPANKQVVGERMAYLALTQTYGQEGFECSGPTLKEMKVDGSIAKLTFDHAEHGLTTYGKELENFEIAGENQRFFPATAFITGEGISVYSPSVPNPVAVRYAFQDFVVGELFNTEGLPASSFRTDDWEMK